MYGEWTGNHEDFAMYVLFVASFVICVELTISFALRAIRS